MANEEWAARVLALQSLGQEGCELITIPGYTLRLSGFKSQTFDYK